jgi:GR25 family glycosyltransferase involved in LPS biosynthesis
MEYKVFCCHHKPLKHRKENIEKYFIKNKIEIIFIESYEFGVDLLDNPYEITNGELSLLLKHYEIFEKIVSLNFDYGFIIEDDLLIPDEFDLDKFFKRIIVEKNESNIIFFGGTHDMYVYNPSNYKIVYENYKSSRCTHGYFIDKETCEKILMNRKFNRPSDHALNEYIESLNLKCSWTYPHLLQGTVERIEKSSLR